jgi:hypothetical protein
VKTLLVTGALLLAVGCSSSGGFDQPDRSDFLAGSCRDMATPVLGLGKTLHALGKAAPTTRQRDALRSDQGLLRKVTPSAALATDYDALVQSVGIVRLRTDSDSYSPDVATTALASYEVLVKACTTP